VQRAGFFVGGKEFEDSGKTSRQQAVGSRQEKPKWRKCGRRAQYIVPISAGGKDSRDPSPNRICHLGDRVKHCGEEFILGVEEGRRDVFVYCEEPIRSNLSLNFLELYRWCSFSGGSS
jgi:hypothetical protein